MLRLLHVTSYRSGQENRIHSTRSSVASTTGRTFGIRVRGGRTEWVDVKPGLTSGPLIEVFGDLKPGNEIATRGTDELKAGASVQVKQAKPA